MAKKKEKKLKGYGAEAAQVVWISAAKARMGCNQRAAVLEVSFSTGTPTMYRVKLLGTDEELSVGTADIVGVEIRGPDGCGITLRLAGWGETERPATRRTVSESTLGNQSLSYIQDAEAIIRAVEGRELDSMVDVILAGSSPVEPLAGEQLWARFKRRTAELRRQLLGDAQPISPELRQAIAQAADDDLPITLQYDSAEAAEADGWTATAGRGAWVWVHPDVPAAAGRAEFVSLRIDELPPALRRSSQP